MQTNRVMVTCNSCGHDKPEETGKYKAILNGKQRRFTCKACELLMIQRGKSKCKPGPKPKVLDDFEGPRIYEDQQYIRQVLGL